MDFGYARYPVLGMVSRCCKVYDLEIERGIFWTIRRDLNWKERKAARQMFYRRQWA